MYILYIKVDDLGYIKYGVGSMTHIRDLMFDYLVVNDMYKRDEVQFKIIRVNRRR